MAQVFISFIHEEVKYAQTVQAFITQIFDANVKPFLSSDQFQVYAGEKWIDRIMDELKEARVVLLMLSEESVKRPWVNFEAGAAWTRNIVTIPICLRGLCKDGLPKPYSSLQAVDLKSYDDHEYLARSIAHHLGIPEPMSFFATALSAIGGLESKKEAERTEYAYENFRSRLKELNLNS